MELTWTVPVALILAVAGYLVVLRVIKHRERMGAADPQQIAALTSRVEVIEASLQRLGSSRGQA